jgi:L-lactate dehydrogenase complex protein LldF
MMKAAGVVLSHPGLYRAAIGTADSALRHLPKFVIYNRFNTWMHGREMPPVPNETFHAWYARHHEARTKGGRDIEPT